MASQSRKKGRHQGLAVLSIPFPLSNTPMATDEEVVETLEAEVMAEVASDHDLDLLEDAMFADDEEGPPIRQEDSPDIIAASPDSEPESRPGQPDPHPAGTGLLWEALPLGDPPAAAAGPAVASPLPPAPTLPSPLDAPRSDVQATLAPTAGELPFLLPGIPPDLVPVLEFIEEAALEGELDAVVAAFEEGLAVRSDCGALYALVGEILLDGGAPEESRAVLRAGVERDPDCPALWEPLVEAELKVGDVIGAATVLQEFLTRFTPGPDEAMRWATLAVQTGDLGAARNLVAAHPERPESRVFRAAIQSRSTALALAVNTEAHGLLREKLGAPLRELDDLLSRMAARPSWDSRDNDLEQARHRIQVLQGWLQAPPRAGPG